MAVAVPPVGGTRLGGQVHSPDPRASGKPVPETPCAHCGLPIGPRPVLQSVEGPAFCCTGCAVVYDALESAGLGATYYRLRDLGPKRGDARPVAADALQLAELDTLAFQAEHTHEAGEGLREVELFLDGVHCAACVWLAERLPYEFEGIVDARLDLPRARLTLRYDPESVRLSEAAQWLSRFGYAAYPARQAGITQRTDAERRLLLRLGIAWTLAGNVMLIAFALYSGLDIASDPTMAVAARAMSLALAIPAVFYCGADFFRRAWASIRLAVRQKDFRHLHMDTPIALGIGVGFSHSAWATLTGRGEVWFDSIAVLIAALLTARWLQLRSRRLAGDATERLLSLIPSMVRRVGEGGGVEVVRVDEVRPGDLVEVPAGEPFPVDGTVDHGTSTVNNAVLTGESRPEPVGPGAQVEAGATNLTAPLRVRVQAAGEATRVGKLLAWVRGGGEGRAPVVLLADRLSGYFVLAVLTLAAATAALWLWIAPAAAVPHVVALLVVTCPCALGMATPLAMTVAAGRAARRGIFIKSDEATQLLTQIDTIVLDKTGTLTEGAMTLADWAGDEAALDLAAALEAKSNHPIAAALVKARATCGLDGRPLLPEPEAFEAVAGEGIRGRVEGYEVIVGRPAWVVTQSAPLTAADERRLGQYTAEGHTPVAVAVDGRPAAVLAIGDRVRKDATATVGRWQAAGYAVCLLSGDHPEVAAAVALQVGIGSEQARGGVSPEAKRHFVEHLRAEGRTVLMVGDGVNDAAALQAADVGVAVGGGSTASFVAADVFMTRHGLAPVDEALRGGQQTLRTIRRNLTLSLLYNVGGATAAMAGLVTPLVAAVAMPISSLVVVASSILQRSFRQQENERQSATGVPLPPFETPPPVSRTPALAAVS